MVNEFNREVRPELAGKPNTLAAAVLGLGAMLAITISWSIHHSVFRAIVHGLFNWLYVIYWCLWGETPWGV